VIEARSITVTAGSRRILDGVSVGVRPGEKLHELMIGADDARSTLDCGDHYVIAPQFSWWQRNGVHGQPVEDGFMYRSDTNPARLGVPEVRALLERIGQL